jgi:hypothetical protein
MRNRSGNLPGLADEVLLLAMPQLAARVMRGCTAFVHFIGAQNYGGSFGFRWDSTRARDLMTPLASVPRRTCEWWSSRLLCCNVGR